jgi:hypothetical protein
MGINVNRDIGLSVGEVRERSQKVKQDCELSRLFQNRGFGCEQRFEWPHDLGSILRVAIRQASISCFDSIVEAT